MRLTNAEPGALAIFILFYFIQIFYTLSGWTVNKKYL